MTASPSSDGAWQVGGGGRRAFYWTQAAAGGAALKLCTLSSSSSASVKRHDYMAVDHRIGRLGTHGVNFAISLSVLACARERARALVGTRHALAPTASVVLLGQGVNFPTRCSALVWPRRSGCRNSRFLAPNTSKVRHARCDVSRVCSHFTCSPLFFSRMISEHMLIFAFALFFRLLASVRRRSTPRKLGRVGPRRVRAVAGRQSQLWLV